MKRNTPDTMKVNIAIRLSRVIEANAVYIALAITVIVFGVLAPSTFLTANSFMDILRYSVTIGLIMVGEFLVIVAGGFDLSVSEIMACGGMFFAFLFVMHGVNSVVSFIITLCFGALLGVLNGLLVTKARVLPFIVTLATAYAFRAVGSALAGGRSINLPNDPFFSFLGQGNVGALPTPVIILIVSLIGAYLFIYRTTFGRQVFATGGNYRAAVLSGVKVDRVRIITYMISGCLSTIAGLIIVSRLAWAQPSMSGIPGFSTVLLDTLAALMIGGVSIFGGIGELKKAIVGVIVIAAVTQGMGTQGATIMEHSIVKGLFILFAVLLQVRRR